jgi:3-hydroxyisobutyrate dehydrogenase
LDRSILCEIISKAAGYNEMFVKCIPAMLENDEWSLADCEQAEEVGRKLGEAVEKCGRIGFPCSMASAALQQFAFAKLRGKTIGGQDRRTR